MTNTAANARTSAKASASFSRRQVTQQPIPDGNKVRPWVTKTFTVDEHVILNGFPYVPKYWARAETAISATGEYFATDRLDPRELNLDCQARFLPGDDLWDDTAGVWRPFFSNGVDYYWEADPAHKPTPDRIEYRIGKEILSFDVLTFNPGDYLASNFNQGMDDAVEYTAVIVCSLENPTPYTIMRSEIDGVDVGETFGLSSGAVRRSVFSRQHPTQIVPCIIVMSVQRPIVSLWVIGPDRNVLYGSLITKEVDIPDLKFRLGQDLFSVSNAFMHVFEWTLFPYAVKDKNIAGQLNVYQLAALYGSVFGAR